MMWKTIVQARNYQISEGGDIRKLAGRFAGHIMRTHDNGYGYLKVKLAVDYDRVMFYVHRLVCEAFHGPPPDGAQARHLDGDPRNNHADNLKWGTAEINAEDKGGG